MQKMADKTQGAQTQAVPQLQRSGQTELQLVEKGPENSPQVRQLQALQAKSNNNPRVKQLKALQEGVGNKPQVQKALQLGALLNGRLATAPGQSQPNSTGLQGHANTPTP